MTRYAESTTVAVERSKAEIESTLSRYGADQFMSGWDSDANRAVVAFRARDRFIRFELPLPDRNEERFRVTPGRGLQRSPDAAYKAWEQAQRQAWRALHLVIKAKLEAIESGVSTFEQEFMAHIVLPDGRTVGDHVLPRIAEAYATQRVPALLPAGGADGR